MTQEGDGTGVGLGCLVASMVSRARVSKTPFTPPLLTAQTPNLIILLRNFRPNEVIACIGILILSRNSAVGFFDNISDAPIIARSVQKKLKSCACGDSCLVGREII